MYTGRREAYNFLFIQAIKIDKISYLTKTYWRRILYELRDVYLTDVITVIGI